MFFNRIAVHMQNFWQIWEKSKSSLKSNIGWLYSQIFKCYKTIQVIWFMCQLCIYRDMKHLGSLESTQEARVAQSRHTLLHLPCSSNFPRASYLKLWMHTDAWINKFLLNIKWHFATWQIEEIKETCNTSVTTNNSLSVTALRHSLVIVFCPQVSFSQIPYHTVIERSHWQDKVCGLVINLFN